MNVNSEYEKDKQFEDFKKMSRGFPVTLPINFLGKN
jgi:hypothetical protein